jgi:hypothetical protein
MQILRLNAHTSLATLSKNGAGRTGANDFATTPLYCGQGKAECGSVVVSG